MFGRLKNEYGLAPRRVRGLARVQLHADLTMLARLSQALLREAGVWPPDGMDYHVCFGQDGDLRVSEIWDSQEKLEAFGQRLMPILSEVGIQPGDPEIHEVQNVEKR